MIHPSRLVLSLALLGAAATPARGLQVAAPDTAEQAVMGVLVDDTNDRPVAGALVGLLRGPERIWSVTTDSAGRFFLPVPLPGFYRLEAQRLGYALTESQPVEVETGLTLTVEFRILPDAILMQPLLVTARSDQGRSIFERRRTEWGRGVFLTPEMVDSINPRHHPAEVFRGRDDMWLSWGTARLESGTWGTVPRMKTYLGSGCIDYMVDRVPVRTLMGDPGGWSSYPLDGLLPQDIVAVELYRYVGEAPPEIRRFAMQRDFAMCGLVVLWTHAGW
jgi:hypothetical protein